MRYLSTILGQASGSLASMTFSRNRYGNVMRAKVNPVNPNSLLQVAIRAIFRAVSHAWTTISPAARSTWKTYADAVSVPDKKMGGRINLTANAMYTRSWVTAQQFGAKVDEGLVVACSAAPIDLSLPSFTPPTITAPATASAISLSINILDAWNTAASGGLIIQSAPHVSPGTNFFRGPYTTIGAIPTGAVVTTLVGTGRTNGPKGAKLPVRITCVTQADATHGPRVSEAYETLVTVGPP